MIDIDFQFFVNVVIALASFFGGWILKVFNAKITKLEEKCDEREDRLINLALNMPKEYVRKDDFNRFSEMMNERFDRLEDKLEGLRK
jgi:hypothetical protein|tara:strand:- start:240 stop:500 length:261 start_codon:yes stop_codon:yes gene_type:complete